MSKSFAFTRKLTESAVMLALTAVLSYVKLVDLPYGGSITLCSMVPMVLIAYRHGMGWGLLTGLANGILQLLMGLNTLSYATSAKAAVAIIMLDYIIAFTVIGFGGVLRKVLKNQLSALALGTVIACVLRYILHVISGCTVWAGLSIPDSKALVYSLAYNATYMLPELIIAVAGAAYLGGVIDFKGVKLSRIAKTETSKSAFWLKTVGLAGGLVGFITDVLLIAPKLQNPDSGNFDITGLNNVNFVTVGIITAVAALWVFAFMFATKATAKNKAD